MGSTQTSRKSVSGTSRSSGSRTAARSQAGDGSGVATMNPELETDAAEPNEPQAAEPSNTDNVDRIREIIFGGQMRDYERKFARLEERVAKESSDLRVDVRRGLEALEVYVGKEVDSLAERLMAEQAERASAIAAVSDELKALAQSLEKRAAQLDEQIAKGHRELRQQIFDESKNASTEIRRSAEDLASVVARESRELREEKADRTALASMFSELALRLSGDLVVPNEEA